MRPSIIGTLFDLLQFEGHGNFGQFDRCFRKTAAFFSLGADDAMLRKLRNIAFWYLRCTGYVDVSYTPSTTSWSTAPPNLVQRGEQDFALVAGSASAVAILAATSRDAVREERSPDGGLVPDRIPFFPSLLCVNTSVTEARDACRRANISLGLSYQSQLFQRVPSVDSVLRRALMRDDDRPFEPESTDRFDFASCTWERFTETRAFEAGLYRQSFDYRAPTYAIVAPSRHKRLATFRVIERDWVLVAALSLLRAALPIRYEKETKRLYVSKRYHASLPLPTLIERCLRSGTLLNPSTTGDWSVYGGVLSSSITRLTGKLPIFSSEVRQ